MTQSRTTIRAAVLALAVPAWAGCNSIVGNDQATYNPDDSSQDGAPDQTTTSGSDSGQAPPGDDSGDSVSPPLGDASPDGSPPGDDGGCTGNPSCGPFGAKQACGNCGVQVCTPGCGWGVCTGQGACASGATQPCGCNGTETCQSDCTWSGCNNQTLVTCYVDADADGYGNPATGTSACSTCPAGQVRDNTDCYDSNASAHPGQTAYFTVNRGDGSFDYDCNGTSDKNPAQVSYLSSCSTTQFGVGCTPPTCTPTTCSTGSSATGACGTSYTDEGGCFCVASMVCTSGCTSLPLGSCQFSVSGPGSATCSGTVKAVGCR